MIHVRGRGLRSLSDLILGLPGETLQSHLAGIDQLLDSGTHELHLFQAMTLKGSELETRASREKYQFDSRFRVLPKAYGMYEGAKVFDVDEIVVSTDTMSFDDYIEARTFALAFTIFWNNSWFEDAVGFVKQFGVKSSEWMRAMRKALDGATGSVARLVDDFVAETKNELFPTRDACAEFYSKEENWQRLIKGQIGDNLMYKYRALAGFFLWPDICRTAMDATRRLLIERGARDEVPGFEAFWADFERFVERKHAHGSDAEQLLTPRSGTFHYDIPAWIEAGNPKNVDAFRLAESCTFQFELPTDSAAEIEALLQTWTASLQGLTKGVTRIRTTSLIRRARPIAPTAEPRFEAIA